MAEKKEKMMEGLRELLLELRNLTDSLATDARDEGHDSELDYMSSLSARITAHFATAAANGPGEAVVVSALKTIAEFPVTNERTNLDAANMRRIAVNALLLASTPQPGMVTVPREPTREMLIDGAKAVRDFHSEKSEYPRTRAMYRAMLDAALRSGGRETES